MASPVPDTFLTEVSAVLFEQAERDRANSQSFKENMAAYHLGHHPGAPLPPELQDAQHVTPIAPPEDLNPANEIAPQAHRAYHQSHHPGAPLPPELQNAQHVTSIAPPENTNANKVAFQAHRASVAPRPPAIMGPSTFNAPFLTDERMAAFHLGHFPGQPLPIELQQHKNIDPIKPTDALSNLQSADATAQIQGVPAAPQPATVTQTVTAIDPQDDTCYEGGEDDDCPILGYYPDGNPRFITDDEIELFRHSEIWNLLRAREAQESEYEPDAEHEAIDDQAQQELVLSTEDLLAMSKTTDDQAEQEPISAEQSPTMSEVTDDQAEQEPLSTAEQSPAMSKKRTYSSRDEDGYQPFDSEDDEKYRKVAKTSRQSQATRAHFAFYGEDPLEARKRKRQKTINAERMEKQRFQFEFESDYVPDQPVDPDCGELDYGEGESSTSKEKPWEKNRRVKSYAND
ncbi:hypothetical protein N7532_010292 [Penicillium argentinense]|uniref:Uncharacterized protein n=1 Tax=Penicillium argentinense TaxID=1131581 RepID=A0A9W9EPD9_9EURO|nr:uncharacterized protein N7532_010292 [Penicillium argentinense]KAJ5085521.1 hypothetical protein N7532_010292 [Penicillium argentinense]